MWRSFEAVKQTLAMIVDMQGLMVYICHNVYAGNHEEDADIDNRNVET